MVLGVSCTKDSNDDLNSHDYLVKYEKISTLQKSFISSYYATASLQYPDLLELNTTIQHDVEVYKIIYRTSFKGEGIEASGLLSIPLEAGSFPIISFQNGTNTSHNNAPTENSNSSFMFLLSSLATNGYILLIPDYIGFGSSNHILHPYYQKKSSNQVIIDFLYAAKEFVDNYNGSASNNDDYYLMGYSQGGWATLAALEEIEKNSKHDFNVLATSCGAGAYNLINVSNYILDLNTFPGPLYLPYYIYSHQQYGSITDELDLFFQKPYASIIPVLFDGSVINSQVNAQLTESIPELLTSNFIENFESGEAFAQLRNDLVENSVNAWSVNSELHFYHGDIDLNVPPSESENIYNGFVTEVGDQHVGHIVMDDLNHETGVVPWGVKTILWFNEINAVE